jgi:large subunit ribosomal protein L28
MANICEITGKRKLRGHRVSHANNKSIHFQQPSTQMRRIFIPELGSRIRLNVSSAGLRLLNKIGGISRFLIKACPDSLSPQLRQLRKVLLKKGIHS